jgi:hypothetical protein
VAIYVDWFEWTENLLNTFLSRLKDAIDNDTTIANYSPTVIIVTDEDLERKDVNAKLENGRKIF